MIAVQLVERGLARNSNRAHAKETLASFPVLLSCARDNIFAYKSISMFDYIMRAWVLYAVLMIPILDFWLLDETCSSLLVS